MRVLVIGEINPDLVMQDYSAFPTLGKEVIVNDLVLALGSASAICAMGLARLGNEVTFLGKVGQDPWAAFCLEVMSSRRIDLSPVIRDAGVKTGLTVSVSSAKDRALITYPGAIAALSAAEVDEHLFENRDHVHISSFFLQEALRPGCKSVLAAAHRNGLTTSLDPGYDPAERWGQDLIDVLTEVDVFLPNEVELHALTGCESPEDGVRALANGRTLTVAKLGSAGAMSMAGGDMLRVPAAKIEPVDTTGAGDSFNAGFLHAWKRSEPLPYTLAFASACGAMSTLGVGGVSAQPEEAEALEFLERQWQITGRR